MRGRPLSIVMVGAWVVGACWIGPPCLAATAPHDSAAAVQDPLRRLGIDVAGEAREIGALEVVGLETLSEAQLWTLVDEPTPPFAFARAAQLVEALDRTEAFAGIEPRLRVAESGELTLVLRLAEHVRVETVAFRGLDEADVPAHLDALLGTPAGARPPAPPSIFASVDAGVVRSGILRGGVRGAVDRLVKKLFAAGLLMVDVRGVLGADGTLSVDVDEGRIEEMRLVGPAERLGPAVREALDLAPGRVFDQTELAEARARVERALPFLRLDASPHPTRALPTVETASDGRGGTRFSLSESPPQASTAGFSVEGRRLTLYLRPKLTVRFGVSPDELLRHTPVAGIGVGVQTETRLWDPKDRVHLRLDTFGGTVDRSVLDKLGKTDLGGEYQTTLRLRVPPLRIADLSASAYGFLDTPDSWRTGRQTSYLSSLLFDRPDREYYWREGTALSLTLQPSGRLLIGAEHRVDGYRSVASLEKPPTLFNRDERFANPAIQEGQIGSVVLRAELRSEAFGPERIRGLFQSPETSIVTQERSWGLRTGYQVLTTVEIARRGLGSDPGLTFTRLVSDDVVFLATGPESGLRLRVRVAGGSHLPLQKQEALGGWSALRGYDFKEFRGGDWSWLGSVEYRHEWLSGFVDVGSVRQPQGWTGPKAGAGLKLHFDSLPVVGRWLKNRRLLPPIQLAAAWRLDRAGKADPSVRLLVGQLF